MAKQTARTRSTREDGPRVYVVLHATTEVDLKRLGTVKARDADKAIASFADYDPKDLVGIPAARWNERKGVCLENEPKLNLGEPVPLIDGQMAMDAAA